MSSGVSRLVTGAYEGTGAAQSIAGDKVGFKPKRITIWRIDTQRDKSEWIEGMADGTGLTQPGDGSATVLTATQMITPTATGFDLGTAAAVNNAGDTYRYTAEE